VHAYAWASGWTLREHILLTQSTFAARTNKLDRCTRISAVMDFFPFKSLILRRISHNLQLI